MKKSVLGYGILAAVMGAAMTGCMMTGSYQSAKTLEPGTSNFGLTFGVNEIKIDSTSVSFPNPIPELSFHTGIAENMEVGGRIALGSLGLEGDFKYRFFHAGNLHLAMIPAIGYQGLLVMKGVTFSLPMVGTIELSKHFGLTAALFGRYANFSSSDSSVNAAVRNIVGDAVMFGGAFGPDISGETFFFRPMIELARVNPAAKGQWPGWNRVSVAVHLGWIMGREKQQLDRIEKKIDKMNNSGRSPEQKKTDPEK